MTLCSWLNKKFCFQIPDTIASQLVFTFGIWQHFFNLFCKCASCWSRERGPNSWSSDMTRIKSSRLKKARRESALHSSRHSSASHSDIRRQNGNACPANDRWLEKPSYHETTGHNCILRRKFLFYWKKNFHEEVIPNATEINSENRHIRLIRTCLLISWRVAEMRRTLLYSLWWNGARRAASYGCHPEFKNDDYMSYVLRHKYVYISKVTDVDLRVWCQSDILSFLQRVNTFLFNWDWDNMSGLIWPSLYEWSRVTSSFSVPCHDTCAIYVFDFTWLYEETYVPDINIISQILSSWSSETWYQFINLSVNNLIDTFCQLHWWKNEMTRVEKLNILTQYIFKYFEMKSIVRDSTIFIDWQWIKWSSERRVWGPKKDTCNLNKMKCMPEVFTFKLDFCRERDYSLSWRVLSPRKRILFVQWHRASCCFAVNDHSWDAFHHLLLLERFDDDQEWVHGAVMCIFSRTFETWRSDIEYVFQTDLHLNHVSWILFMNFLHSSIMRSLDHLSISSD